MSNNLKDLRKMSGRKQADVAAEAGISREYLSALENGRQKLGRSLAEKFAAIYGVSPADLMGYWIPDPDRSLRDERDSYKRQIERLKQDYAQQLQNKQLRIEALEQQLEQALHALAFAESVCDMLKLQINSKSDKGTEGENG